MKESRGALLLGLVLAGCLASPEESRLGGVADSPPHDHFCAAALCRSAGSRALEEASNTDALLGAVDEKAECLRGANDGTVAAIEERLATSSSDLAGSVMDAFASLRAASDGLCSLAVAAGDTAEGSSARLIGSDCLASREDDLAILIDAWVDLGVGTFPIGRSDDGDDALCAEIGAVGSEERAECLQNEVLLLVTPVARAVWDNDPTVTLPDAVLDVQTSLFAATGAIDQLCDTLAEAAGADDIDPGCRADAALQVYGLLVGFSPTIGS